MEVVTGNQNTAVGYIADYLLTTGGNNTFIGAISGVRGGANAVTTGSGNTYIGAAAGPGSTTQYNNSTGLGINAEVNSSREMAFGSAVSGERPNYNFGGLPGTFGGGFGVIHLANYSTVPTSAPTAGSLLYDSAGLFRIWNAGASAAFTVGSGGGGSGTVTSVTSANGAATVATTTTTPVITIVSAPKLTTARTINGTSFDGTGNITVTAAAGTLTGSTLATGVISSSLISGGTNFSAIGTNQITLTPDATLAGTTATIQLTDGSTTLQPFSIQGAQGNATNNDGGSITVRGGTAYPSAGNGNGGALLLQGGLGHGAGVEGVIKLGTTSTIGYVWTAFGTDATGGWAAPSSGGLSGLTTNRIPYATSSTTLGDDAAMTWDNTNKAPTFNSARIISKTTKGFFFGNGAGNFTTITTADGFNTGIGYGALTSVTDNATFSNASYNTALGYQSLTALTIGPKNTALGYKALAALVDGYENVAIGTNALLVTTAGYENVAIGSGVLKMLTTGYDNTIIGSIGGGLVTTGHDNAGIGFGIFNGLTTGNNNVAVGPTAALALLSGTGNVFIGSASGSAFTTGGNNTAIGTSSGIVGVSGSGNTYIGAAAYQTAGTWSNSTSIGYDATFSSSREMSFGSAVGGERPNYVFGSAAPSFGSGFGILYIADAATAVSGTISSGAGLWSSSGTLQETIGANNYKVSVELAASSILDFPSTTAGTASDLTITVTGAANTDTVSLGVDTASTLSDGSFSAWVSAANTVTVRFTNNSLTLALDPASGTFKTVVHK
jgi:hypothetical protein